jgi:hypothetical protein
LYLTVKLQLIGRKLIRVKNKEYFVKMNSKGGINGLEYVDEVLASRESEEELVKHYPFIREFPNDPLCVYYRWCLIKKKATEGSISQSNSLEEAPWLELAPKGPILLPPLAIVRDEVIFLSIENELFPLTIREQVYTDTYHPELIALPPNDGFFSEGYQTISGGSIRSTSCAPVTHLLSADQVTSFSLTFQLMLKDADKLHIGLLTLYCLVHAKAYFHVALCVRCL